MPEDEVAHKYFANLLPEAMLEFESVFGSYPALQRVQSLIVKQCRRIVAQ